MKVVYLHISTVHQNNLFPIWYERGGAKHPGRVATQSAANGFMFKIRSRIPVPRLQELSVHRHHSHYACFDVNYLLATPSIEIFPSTCSSPNIKTNKPWNNG